MVGGSPTRFPTRVVTEVIPTRRVEAMPLSNTSGRSQCKPIIFTGAEGRILAFDVGAGSTQPSYGAAESGGWSTISRMAARKPARLVRG